jgi:hypothetical protein
MWRERCFLLLLHQKLVFSQNLLLNSDLVFFLLLHGQLILLLGIVLLELFEFLILADESGNIDVI